MKIESFLNNGYNIYLNNSYINNNCFSDMGEFIKKVIIKLKDIYNIKLKGFYSADVYINEKIGIFIKIKKKNKYDFYMDDIDLRIYIHNNVKVYYKTDNLDIIYKYRNNIIKYKDNYFYIDISSIDKSIMVLDLIEFGSFIFG